MQQNRCKRARMTRLARPDQTYVRVLRPIREINLAFAQRYPSVPREER